MRITYNPHPVRVKVKSAITVFSALLIINTSFCGVCFANNLADTLYCQNMASAYKDLMCYGVSARTVYITQTSYHLQPADADIVASTVSKDKQAGATCDFSNDYNSKHNEYFRNCLLILNK